VFLAGWPATAIADVTPGDASAATALFDAGRAELDAGRIDEACEKFELSLKFDPQLGTRLNLGVCRERQGKLVDAYELFAVAADEAKNMSKDVRANYARTRLAQLRAKLVRIVLRVAKPDMRGLALDLATPTEHTRLERGAWGWARMTTPGEVVIVATAPDHKPLRLIKEAVGGAEIELDIDLPPLVEPTPPPPPPEAPEQPGRPITPYLVMGGGGALLVGSLLLGLHGKSIYDDALTKKGPQIDSQIDTAEVWADVGTGVAIAGVAAVGVGIYLWLHDDDATTTVAPVADAHGAGVSLMGSW
jgi:hypothetical protein